MITEEEREEVRQKVKLMNRLDLVERRLLKLEKKAD